MIPRDRSQVRILSPRRWSVLLGSALAVAVPLGACGGGGSPSAPQTPAASTPPPAGATITITASGVTPKELQVSPGARVTFVNQDTAFHEMSSNPHPVHSECPQINEVSALAPGQSRQTGAFTTARSCGFHDHGQPGNAALQGTIVIR